MERTPYGVRQHDLMGGIPTDPILISREKKSGDRILNGHGNAAFIGSGSALMFVSPLGTKKKKKAESGRYNT
jgi:hypothetical protein